MGKGSPSTPAAPDPNATATAQAAANKEAVRESALVNQYNQQTPYGSITWSGKVGGPDRTQTIAYNPEQQAILDAQMGVSGGLSEFAQDYVPQVTGAFSSPFSTKDIGVARPQADDVERQRIEEALMGRLDPYLQRDEDALRARLATQGIQEGSGAYSQSMDDFNRARTDARLAAIGQAGSEYERDFGLQSQAYNQAIADALLNRTQGINELSALIQGSPAIGSPPSQPVASYNIPPPDLMGATYANYNAAQNQYNQRMAGQRAGMGGLFDLGGALGSSAIMKWSDRRLKRDIRLIDENNGLPIYSYSYIWGGDVQVGPMAQDVLKVKPDAVHVIDGYLAVDYAKL